MDIKRSLTLRFLLLVVSLLAGFSMVVYQNYAHYRKVDYYERLTDRITSFSKLIINASEKDSAAEYALRNTQLRPMLGQHIAIIDNQNEFLTHDSTRQYLDYDLVKEIRTKKLVQFEVSDTDYVGLLLKHNNAEYVVLGGAVDAVGKKKLDYLGHVIIISFFIAIIIAAFFGWYFSSQALKPMQKVVEEADQITASNLHKRLPIVNDHDEIGKLSATFNKMLDRLEASFLMQKNFVSNASHEFRTPITAVKAQIEVMLMQERSKEEYITTLKSIGEDIDSFIQLVTSLSELAKANLDSSGGKPVSVPIIEIVAESRAEIIRSKPRYRVDLQIVSLPENDQENYIAGNTALLKSAVKNLIENACKFSPDMHCEVFVDFEPGNVIIKVVDEGTGIAPEEVDHIFEPFYRANDTRGIAGHGIGLSLVKKIVELHNGTITVESELSKGTKMIVKLPNKINENPLVSFMA